MRGFSFVDDINRSKRNEARLEDELQRQRTRQDQQDKIAAEERQFTLSERDRAVNQRERLGEASRLMADPNVDPALLEEYADIPEVSAAIRGEISAEQARNDMVRALRGEDISGGQLAAQPPSNPAPGAQPPGGLATQVQAAVPPSNQPTPYHTQEDLNQLSLADPAAATAIRDEQNAKREQERARQEAAQVNDPLGFTTGITRPQAKLEPTEFEKAEKQRAKNRGQATSQWGAYGDINNPNGDALRNASPTQQVGIYWQERGGIDPVEQQAADKRIMPAVQETITSQREILTNPELDPNGLEARNARRKMSQAMGLAKEISGSFRPLEDAGVDKRGLPINGSNPQLTNAAIESIKSAPVSSVPNPTQQQRVDVTMINRGTKGRVSERFAQGAARLWQDGRIDSTQLESLIKTGRMPQGTPDIQQ